MVPHGLQEESQAEIGPAMDSTQVNHRAFGASDSIFYIPSLVRAWDVPKKAVGSNLQSKQLQLGSLPTGVGPSFSSLGDSNTVSTVEDTGRKLRASDWYLDLRLVLRGVLWRASPDLPLQVLTGTSSMLFSTSPTPLHPPYIISIGIRSKVVDSFGC
jgi:hypothetical protein